MTLYHALLLGLLQGATEFLPISSSGHLALLEQNFRLPFDPLTLQHFDIVLHGGSLLAILLYFGKTWLRILRRPFAKEKQEHSPLLLLLIIGTLPAAVAGFFGQEWLALHGRTPIALGIGFLITGAFLLASSFYAFHCPGQERVSVKQALGMGIGQALALFPSISRSGVTIASGRFLGLEVSRATEVGFLLSAPALGGAIFLTLLTGGTDIASIGWPQALIGFSTSFVASLATIHLFLATIRTYGLWIWSLYLFPLGLFIIGDELLPVLREITAAGTLRLPVGPALAILAITLLLEAAPLTSFFVPGFLTMAMLGVLFRSNMLALVLCILVGTVALILGNLLGYLPAREALKEVHWKEKADERLHRAERFFKKWGFFAVLCGIWYGPVRSFISVAAGLGNMPPRTFLLAVSIGSILWTTVVLVASAYFGRVIW